MKQLLLSCLIAVMHLEVFGGVPPQTSRISSSATGRNSDISLMQPDDTAYEEAMEFTRFLSDHGIVVKSVHRSKMESFFDGVTKAAFIKTGKGILEVLFFPEPTGAEKVQVTERREEGRYLYSFEGQPEPKPNDMIDSSYRNYFTMRQNLFIKISDKELDAVVKRALEQR